MPSPFFNTGARYGIRALLGTSNISDIDLGMQAMRDDVEAKMAGYTSGTNAARLAAPALDGQLWRETDTGGGLLYVGNGSTWESVVPSRGAVNIPASESRTNTAYGTLTTPDQVTGIVLPANGLIRVWYQATWQESVAGAARAAIFLGANQVVRQATTTPAAAETPTSVSPANTNTSLATTPLGLASQGTATGADVTTGQVIGTTAGGGGSCDIAAAAGTYTVAVMFKASSGSVTASNRKLWVQASSFS